MKNEVEQLIHPVKYEFDLLMERLQCIQNYAPAKRDIYPKGNERIKYQSPIIEQRYNIPKIRR